VRYARKSKNSKQQARKGSCESAPASLATISPVLKGDGDKPSGFSHQSREANESLRPSCSFPKSTIRTLKPHTKSPLLRALLFLLMLAAECY